MEKYKIAYNLDSEIGKNGTPFRITLNKDFHNEEDILKEKIYLIKNIKNATIINAKWYHKLINKITFGLVFDLYYSYEVELELKEE